MPHGLDTLIVPAYLVSDDTDPAYQRWRQDHPDAFVAGTWTSDPPARRPNPPTPAGPGLTDPTTPLQTSALLDQPGLSVNDFLAMSKKAVGLGGSS